MAKPSHQKQLDRLIEMLISVRNNMTKHWDMDFDIDSQLIDCEVSIQLLSNEVQKEVDSL